MIAIVAINVHSIYLGHSLQVVMVKGDTALDMRMCLFICLSVTY